MFPALTLAAAATAAWVAEVMLGAGVDACKSCLPADVLPATEACVCFEERDWSADRTRFGGQNQTKPNKPCLGTASLTPEEAAKCWALTRAVSHGKAEQEHDSHLQMSNQGI